MNYTLSPATIKEYFNNKLITAKEYGEDRITLKPWSGKCAITGLTMDDFAMLLNGVNVPAAVSRAAVSIARSYGHKGLCDVGHIANVINNELEVEAER